MAVAYIKKGHFSAGSHIYSAAPRGLTEVVRSILHMHAFAATVGITALTDNSGGVNGVNTLAAIPALTPFTTTGAADCAPKAGWDAMLVNLRNNLSDLTTRVNLIAAKVPAVALTDNTGGTGDTTEVAITQVFTAVTGTTVCLDVVTATSLLATYKTEISTLASAINALAGAFGVTPLTDNTSGVPLPVSVFPPAYTLPAVAVATAAGVPGTALGTVSNVQAQLVAVALAGACTTMATKLNSMVAQPVAALSVIAV